MIVHSYGAGVQSVTILHMYLHGDMPKPDMVIFADTQAEPEEVYRVLERDKRLCEDADIPLYVVTNGDLAATDSYGGVFVPTFSRNANGDKGMLRRQCTQRWKIQPIRKFLKSIGVKKCQMIIGISTDEISRAKPSSVKWIENIYPLIDMKISRNDCLLYLEKIGVTAAKSACVFCPYQSDHEWLRVKSNANDWQKALEYDRAVRHKRPKSTGLELYVHSECIPLNQVSFANPELQPGLWDEECGGGCGL